MFSPIFFTDQMSKCMWWSGAKTKQKIENKSTEKVIKR